MESNHHPLIRSEVFCPLKYSTLKVTQTGLEPANPCSQSKCDTITLLDEKLKYVMADCPLPFSMFGHTVGCAVVHLWDTNTSLTYHPAFRQD